MIKIDIIVMKERDPNHESQICAKGKVALFALLAAIKACNVLFVAYMLKVMLNIASSGKSDYGRLVMFAALTAGGQLFFHGQQLHL